MALVLPKTDTKAYEQELFFFKLNKKQKSQMKLAKKIKTVQSPYISYKTNKNRSESVKKGYSILK